MNRSRKKKKGSFGSALLLGVIFGTVMVLGQELIYQQTRIAGYSTEVDRQDLPAIVSETEPSKPGLILEPGDSGESSDKEGGASEDGPVQTGSPSGYTYSEGSTAVTVDIGDGTAVIDFAEWVSRNKDFKGVFIIPDTGISYPVVQGSDNNYYLKHTIDGNYSDLGTLFIDYRNLFMSDENLLIYGHNFYQDGEMFSKLINYKKQSYYDAHPTAYYLTAGGGYKIEIFSAYETSVTDEIFSLTFSSEDEYGKFLENTKSKSGIKTDITVGSGDKVMTLSTCSNTSNEGRFVVVGKIVPFE